MKFLKESINDGWDKIRDLESFEEIFYDLDSIAYEINNTVKGAYSKRYTYQDFGEYLISLSDELRSFGEQVKRIEEDEESLEEDTVKTKSGKWVNKGDTGETHGEFETKKEADGQRKAMFAQGFKG